MAVPQPPASRPDQEDRPIKDRVADELTHLLDTRAGLLESGVAHYRAGLELIAEVDGLPCVTMGIQEVRLGNADLREAAKREVDARRLVESFMGYCSTELRRARAIQAATERARPGPFPLPGDDEPASPPVPTPPVPPVPAFDLSSLQVVVDSDGSLRLVPKNGAGPRPPAARAPAPPPAVSPAPSSTAPALTPSAGENAGLTQKEAEVADLLRAGVLYPDIERRTGLNVREIRDVGRKAGIKPRWDRSRRKKRTVTHREGRGGQGAAALIGSDPPPEDTRGPDVSSAPHRSTVSDGEPLPATPPVPEPPAAPPASPQAPPAGPDPKSGPQSGPPAPAPSDQAATSTEAHDAPSEGQASS